MDMEIANKTSSIEIKKFESYSKLKEIFKEEGLKNFAIEYNLIADTYTKLNDDLNLSIEHYVEEERVRKSPDEIKKIDTAMNIAHKSLLELNPRLKQEEKKTEWETAYELGYLMRKNGAEEESFDTIVASGTNSSLPHAVVSQKLLDPHILIDYGCKFQGYCSDTTRTYPYTEKQQEIFEIVLEAHDKAIKAIKPGVDGSEIDIIARDIITEYGYGDKFIHTTGHSLGLDIHEEPRLSFNYHTILENNMIVTVEPGIYLEGDFGVRIEDTILIDNKGKILGNLPQRL
jgi:Xaa-Pro dipeptidase